MVNAPSMRANCSANSDTPPVPCVTTTSPGLNPAPTIALHAVTAAQGSVDACAAL